MSDSPVFMGQSDDPRMVTAIKTARKTFKFFWRELSWEYRRIIPGLEVAAIKLAFKTNKRRFLGGDVPESEMMWVTSVQFDGRTVKGELLNKPNWIKGLKAGSEVESPFLELQDWMYSIEGIVYGGYTVQVLRSTMPPAEREQHDAAWGLDFGDPDVVRLAPRPVRGDDGEITTDDSQPVTDRAKLAAAEHPMSVNMKSQAKEMLESNPGISNQADSEGWTMLQREALAGNATSVYAMLKYGGADKTLTNPYGESAMDLARKMGWPKVIEVLEKY